MRIPAFVLCVLAMSPAAFAEPLEIGTWIRRGDPLPIVLTVEKAGAGRKLTYVFRLPGEGGKPETRHTLEVVTLLDGKEAPVTLDGKPSDQTFAIRRIDERRAITVSSGGSRKTGTSATELSRDGKVMKVEVELFDSSGTSFSKTTEYWDRK